ncbi:MAG: MFS transporter [Pseudohaliea sp.]
MTRSTLRNRVSVTLACFLAYCVMSGMLAPIGVVLPPLAEQLGIPVPAAAALFSWLTVGILVGSGLALVVFDLLSLRSAMLLVYTAIGGSLLLLRFTESPWLLRLVLGVVGAGCGIGLAGAASGIALLFEGERRASMLVVTDGFFSGAGAATSAVAVLFVAAGLHWASSYLLVGAVAVLIVLLAASARFPASAAERVAPVSTGASPLEPAAPWPAAVWLCIAALFLYTLGQNSMLWWLPSHLEAALSMPRGAAGSVVSRYWTGMFCGQLLVAWWVLRLGARRTVLASSFGTLLGSLPLWTVTVPAWLPWLAFAWGLANFGLLKVTIAFASDAVPVPTPRLIAALLFGATLGTAVSPLVTSAVVAAGDELAVLRFSSFCYLLLAGLILLARRLATPAPAMSSRETP